MTHVHSPGFVRLADEAKRRVRECSVDDFLARLELGERFILIDVREESEWSLGHLPGAHHLARGILEREIEAALPEKDAPIVVYCGDGYRSALAAENLQKMSYANVLSLQGGCKSWLERGLPVVTPGADG